MKRRRARARRRRERHFVVDDEPLDVPPGVVVPEGVVDDEPVAEPDPLVEPLGDAEGDVLRLGVLLVLPVSAWLQAAVTPASRPRAHRPDSNFFIVHAPPCGVFGHVKGVQPICPWPRRMSGLT